jgi:amino acid adenylation domain-containing protein
MTVRLDHWVSAHAAVRPHATAIVAAADRWTYAELDELSTSIAAALAHDGCVPGERVALLAGKSPTAIAALLGIYKAGAIYVPLDPAGPARRLATILDACDTRRILADDTAGPMLDMLRTARPVGFRLGWLGHTPPPQGPVAFTRESFGGASTLDRRPLEDDAAHILFTSGSTGVPKGVLLTHANVVSFVQWAVTALPIQDTDRVSGYSALHFDLSFLDIFGAFAAGAELHLVPTASHVFPHQLTGFIRDHALTQWFSVPSVLTYLAQLDAVRTEDMRSLRRVMWCGDVLPTPVLQYWMDRVPHADFVNLYGPTETAVASAWYRVPHRPADAAAPIPIGQACEGEELLVLDAEMRPAGPEEVGDLYIGGAGVARGYWRDPERTAGAFVAHPGVPGARLYRTGDLGRIGRDGLAYFLGRQDSQVKSRGFRVELGEVETALAAVPGVHDAAVVALETTHFDGAAICGAYVPAPGSPVTVPMIDRHLRERLPAYMCPTRWLLLDQLPRTANGKTDRRELTRQFAADAQVRAAASA